MPIVPSNLSEKAFSFFLYRGQNGAIMEIGYVCYPINESVERTRSAMLDAAASDSQRANRSKLSEPLAADDYMAMCRVGSHGQIFENIFIKENAASDPFCIITNIVDENPAIDMVSTHRPFRYPQVRGIMDGMMTDYLDDYTSTEGFDLPRLLEEDYFRAIKLLFNNGHYVSCAKLTMSFLDTIGFIEFGDRTHGFCQWLDEYVDLSKHQITSEEIWELRNGLLHMSNLDSRKVRDGKVSRIFIYVCDEFLPQATAENTRYLNLGKFLSGVTAGIEKWISTYNSEPKKFQTFVKRYDLTVSDIRVARVHLHQGSET